MPKLRDAYKIALVIIVAAIVLGAIAGFLVQGNQPPDQHFEIQANAFQTPPETCPGILQNASYWLQILVVGNRTNINFISTEILTAGQAQLRLPLNQTAYAYYNPINSSLEKIDVPLAGYFNYGDSLEVSVNYFILGFPPTSFTVGKTPITATEFSC
ncbi:MAG TPA: hypothetical protein VJN71_06435 [Nitrososphaerales archaeon]|nr:hypothetical protein [Nitrososphaerales archaeon]